MDKNSDSLLPYLGLEGISDHPRFQGSSSRARLISRQSEAPATKVSTLQPKEASHKIACPPVPVESRRSQLPKEPLEPDDMMHMKQGLFTKHHSRVPTFAFVGGEGLFGKSTPMESPRRSIGLQSIGDTINEDPRQHPNGASSPSCLFATTAPLRILHRGSRVPNMPMPREPGQGRQHEVYRDSVLELLDQFPSPISPSCPVTPPIGGVSIAPLPPSSPSNTPTMPRTLANPKSDMFSKSNTCQRRSEMPLFSPLFQEEPLQEQGSRFTRDVHEIVQLMVPDGLAADHRTLARSSSNLSASSLGDASDIRPRSHWTAEEEALLDEYRCRSIQESNSDISRATRDSSIIFYNPFLAAEGGEDEEDEEDLPIEVLRKRLKLLSTLLPQCLDTISPVLDPTMTSHAPGTTSTEDPGLAGIGCGTRNRLRSAFVPTRLDVGGGPKCSIRPLPALSTAPSIVDRTFLGEYSPSMASPSLAEVNDEVKTEAEVPLKEYLPANFELALGGTSRYPAFPTSRRPENRMTLSPQVVVSNQPPDRPLAQSSPSVPPLLVCSFPSPKPVNLTDYPWKRGFSEPTLTSSSKRLRNNPTLEDGSGAEDRGLTNINIPSYLPAVFGIHETETTTGNAVQTAHSQSGLQRVRRVVGASNWRPPTCWEMPGWEPAIDLIGEKDDRGHIVTVTSPQHGYASSSGLVEPVLAFAPGSRVIFTHTSSPPLSSPPLSASKMSYEMQPTGQFRRLRPLAFIHDLAQRRGGPTSRSRHVSNFRGRV